MVNQIHVGDALDVMRGWPDDCVDCCVTSPPYWGLRDYGVDGQLGLEPTPEEYTARMVEVFAEVKRVLKPTGTLWLNLGDSYSGYHGNSKVPDDEAPSNKPGYIENMRNSSVGIGGLKPKDLIGIPWRVAFALQADGWYLRSDIIWHKPNPMPESCKDRPTSAHEHIFLLSKNSKYYYDADAIAEGAVCANPDHENYRANGKSDKRTNARVDSGGRPGFGDSKWKQPETRNARNVWTMATKPYKEAHFATFPPELPRKCILAGCPPGGIVLDPFFGSGTVGEVAAQLGRNWVGIELNPQYAELAKQRTKQAGLF